MKTFLLSIFLLAITLTGYSQKNNPAKAKPATVSDTAITVEASCGQCNFKLSGKGCNLAIRIKDEAYFVDGAKIDDHGDAHAEDGFCNKVRHAKVKGKVVDGRFKATYFKLLPEEEKTH